MALILSFFAPVVAQKKVTIVVSGQGSTKEEATANALRSAVEQAYGVFVSANTQILNDEVVRDQMATLSSGNIRNYKELSHRVMSNGNQSVTLSTEVSIKNLISYAKNHGASAEFAGQVFMANMKLRQLNEENEYKMLVNLRNQVALSAHSMFDYEIKILKEPEVSDSGYRLEVEIHTVPNKNFKKVTKSVKSTLRSISLSEIEVEDLKKNNIESYVQKIASKQYYFRNSTEIISSIFYDIYKCINVASNSWILCLNGNDGCFLSYVPTMDFVMSDLPDISEMPEKKVKTKNIPTLGPLTLTVGVISDLVSILKALGKEPYYKPPVSKLESVESNLPYPPMWDYWVLAVCGPFAPPSTSKVTFYLPDSIISSLAGIDIRPNRALYDKCIEGVVF